MGRVAHHLARTKPGRFISFRSNTAISTQPRPDPSMSDSPVRHVSWESLPKEELKPGLSRNWVNGEKGMLAQIYFDKGVIVPKHSHENEQFAYVLKGALLFRIGDDQSEEVIVHAGEVLHIPSHVPHSAEALEDTLDLDIFVPPRQDWLAGTDDYLRG